MATTTEEKIDWKKVLTSMAITAIIGIAGWYMLSVFTDYKISLALVEITLMVITLIWSIAPSSLWKKAAIATILVVMSLSLKALFPTTASALYTTAVWADTRLAKMVYRPDSVAEKQEMKTTMEKQRELDAREKIELAAAKASEADGIKKKYRLMRENLWQEDSAINGIGTSRELREAEVTKDFFVRGSGTLEDPYVIRVSRDCPIIPLGAFLAAGKVTPWMRLEFDKSQTILYAPAEDVYHDASGNAIFNAVLEVSGAGRIPATEIKPDLADKPFRFWAENDVWGLKIKFIFV